MKIKFSVRFVFFMEYIGQKGRHLKCQICARYFSAKVSLKSGKIYENWRNEKSIRVKLLSDDFVSGKLCFSLFSTGEWQQYETLEWNGGRYC